ncbi:all-trans-retinol 13,14-reductase-like [Trematomus bernacchii]|uniref:all-trans-retinol 13,14-reductase-like n=1 Tax=Trematomus bernacchii TaxID=40690 RepID=UPI00146D0BD8|nr:all-trans-retinol 13,14-reductase-like [Trematomus bernacchii]
MGAACAKSEMFFGKFKWPLFSQYLLVRAIEIKCVCTLLNILFIGLFHIISGVPPKESSFLINALLLQHYKRGAYYSQGGASEFAFHIINVIEKAGGAVLVRAPVHRVLLNRQNKAYGVTVLKGQEEIEVHAPVVISNAGIFNIFEKFLPQPIQEKPGVPPKESSFLINALLLQHYKRGAYYSRGAPVCLPSTSSMSLRRRAVLFSSGLRYTASCSTGRTRPMVGKELQTSSGIQLLF